MKLVMIDGDSTYDEINDYPMSIKKGQRIKYRKSDGEYLLVVAESDSEIIIEKGPLGESVVYQEVFIKLIQHTPKYYE